MRSTVLLRTLVSVTTAVGIAAGGLAAAGAASATPAPAEKTAVSTVRTQSVAPYAVNNLGLSVSQAKKVQRSLPAWGYRGEMDGYLGTGSWMALQRYMKAYWGYNDAIDGVVGPNTVKALQRWMKTQFTYKGPIDGIAGPDTRAAFKRYANFV